MPDPGQLQDALGGIFSNMFSSGSAKYLVYVGWFIWAIVMLGIGFGVSYWVRYKYKITILEGSIEKDGKEIKADDINKDDIKSGKYVLNVRKVKRDRAMPVKDNGIAKWRLLFNFKKKIEPINYKYIFPGNHVFLFRTGPDTFNPMPKPTVGNPSAVFSVDPFDRAFLNLGIQNDAREYMKETDVRRTMVWAGVIGILCLAAMVIAGWLILKYSAGTAEKIEVASNLLKGITSSVAPR